VVAGSGGSGDEARMIVASTLLFLAEAVTPCTTTGTPRLGGGAVMVRPVGGVEALPFARLGPAKSVRKQARIRQTGAEAQGEEPDGRPPEGQCAAPISIA
jgi:hypothetical protein